MIRTKTLVLTMIVALVVAAVPAAGPAAAAETGTDSIDCSFPVTHTDATGTNVTVEEPPERVVVIGGSASQIIWEINGSDRVVGIDAFSSYLDGAENVTVVSQGIGQVDYEGAVQQEPDLIVVAGNSYRDTVANEFRDSGIPTFKMPDASNISTVYEKTLTMGALLGNCEAARERVDQMQSRVDVVKNAVADADEPSAFFDLGATQDGSGRYTAGPSTFIGDLLDTAGTHNIVADGNFSTAWPTAANEWVVDQDPEWLVVTYTPGSSYGAATPEEARAAVANSSVLTETTAYEEDQVIAVNANYVNQPAPRMVQPLTEITKSVHPDLYAAANQTTTTTTVTTTQTTTTTETTTATTETTTTTEATGTTTGDGGIPGFTAVGALVAAAAAGLLTRRR